MVLRSVGAMHEYPSMGMMKFVTSSCATRTPKALGPSFAVSLAPQIGSAIEREYELGNMPALSRKNGRFSSYHRAYRVFTSSWTASASTCEKSGLTATASMVLGVMPHLAVRPGS